MAGDGNQTIEEVIGVYERDRLAGSKPQNYRIL